MGERFEIGETFLPLKKLWPDEQTKLSAISGIEHAIRPYFTTIFVLRKPAV